MTARLAWPITKETASEFMEDNVLRLAAALAYYAMFSLGPLLVIVIAVAGLFFDKAAVQQEVMQQVQSFVGNKAAETVQTMFSNQTQSGSLIATVLGTIALVFGASGVFGQLKDALNTIWEVQPKEGQGVWGFIRNRFLSFTMVLGIAFLLLVSLVITTSLELVSQQLNHLLPMPGFVAKALHFVISFGVVTLLFAMIFKVLPDAEIGWRDVWVGALGTALLFTIGKFAIGVYLGRQSTSSAYGAAGSVVVILLWVYYSSVILFAGAEFTQVYARKMGSRISPSPHAVRVSEKKREKQGIPHDEHHPAPGELAPEPAYARSAAAPQNGDWAASPKPVSVWAALGTAFLGGWIVHGRVTRKRVSRRG